MAVVKSVACRPAAGAAAEHLDGVDAPRRHRCAKVVVLSNHHRGGVHGPGRPVRACLLEPIGSSGEAENAEERARGLFVACGDGAPFFQPYPEVLDEMAVVVDPLRAGVGTPGRDGGPWQTRSAPVSFSRCGKRVGISTIPPT